MEPGKLGEGATQFKAGFCFAPPRRTRLLRAVSTPRLLLCCALLVALAAGCRRAETAVERSTRENILLQNIGAEPQDLDPHLMQTNAHLNILMALYEGLVSYDPRDLTPQPGVAERWECTPDGLTWTFHLRSDAKWSNGDPVTAEDFLFSLRRILSPGLASPYPFYHFIIRGAEDFARGRTTDFATVGVRAPDARTLVVELTEPAPYLPFLTGTFPWMPVHRATVESTGRLDQPYSGWTKPGRLVSNGPFRLVAWNYGQEIVVEKNSTYWDAAQVRLSGIRYRVIDNEETEERAFRAGQLHITEYIPSSKVPSYHRSAPEQLVTGPYLSNLYFTFNCTQPPFDDVRVRRAFSLAIDRAEIAALLPHSGVSPATGFVPPGAADYDAARTKLIIYDPVAARRELAAAGYPEGRGFPETDLTFATNNRARQIAEAMQQMVEKNLGVRLRVTNVEGKVFHEERVRRTYALSRAGWIADYPDALAFLELMTSTSGQNVSGLVDPIYDGLVAAARRTTDPVARLAQLHAAEEQLLRELPVLPVLFDGTTHLVHPSVRGYHRNALDYHPAKHLWLEPAR